MKPLWSGSLVVGALSIPVRLLGAPEAPEKVSFNKAHRCTAKHLTRIKQKQWCPSCNRELLFKEIKRVFETSPGVLIEVTDEELKTCEVEPSSILRVTHILEGRLNPLYIESTSFLIPDGDHGDEAFETFREGLASLPHTVKRLRCAQVCAELVLNKRLTTVILEPFSIGIVVYALRANSQAHALMMSAASRSIPPSTQVQVSRMRTVLGELPTFSYTQLTDRYHAQVRTLLTNKIEKQSRATLRHTLKRVVK